MQGPGIVDVISTEVDGWVWVSRAADHTSLDTCLHSATI